MFSIAQLLSESLIYLMFLNHMEWVDSSWRDSYQCKLIRNLCGSK